MARPIAPRATVFSAHANPQGNTIMRFAPWATATEIGVPEVTAPSTRKRPSCSTGGNTPGMAVLAKTAFLISPLDRTTSLPVTNSAHTRYRGTAASAKVMVRQFSL